MENKEAKRRINKFIKRINNEILELNKISNDFCSIRFNYYKDCKFNNYSKKIELTESESIAVINMIISLKKIELANLHTNLAILEL